MNEQGKFWALREALWTDRKFRKLNVDARLLFIWACSPPHSNACGYFRATTKDMERVLDAPGEEGIDDRLGLALEQLADAKMVLVDEDNSVVWAVNKAKYSASSKSAINLMRREFKAAPDSPLAKQFVRKHGSVLRIEEDR